MGQRAPKGKTAAPTCGQCSHIHTIYDSRTDTNTLICYRFPPIAVVIDNKPQNMRCAVTADERACGEFKQRLAS